MPNSPPDFIPHPQRLAQQYREDPWEIEPPNSLLRRRIVYDDLEWIELELGVVWQEEWDRIFYACPPLPPRRFVAEPTGAFAPPHEYISTGRPVETERDQSVSAAEILFPVLSDGTGGGEAGHKIILMGPGPNFVPSSPPSYVIRSLDGQSQSISDMPSTSNSNRQPTSRYPAATSNSTAPLPRNLFSQNLSRRPTVSSAASAGFTASPIQVRSDDARNDILERDEHGDPIFTCVPGIKLAPVEDPVEAARKLDNDLIDGYFREQFEKDEAAGIDAPEDVKAALQRSLNEMVASIDDDAWMFEGGNRPRRKILF